MDNFYITLPSNSSMDSYPSNTMSHYTTKLPQRLNLEGDWEVALVEIQIPQTWNNVDASNDDFQITYTGQRKRVTIPHGYYESAHTLLYAMTRAITEDDRQHIQLQYNDNSRRVSCNIVKPELGITFAPGLAEMLGITFRIVSTHDPRKFYGKYPADISRGIYNVYVNTDVVVPQLVGDTYASLLQIVPVDYRQRGELIFNRFFDPDYIPVKFNTFKTIEIRLTTDFGETITINLGKTYCKLHFRKLK